MQIDFNDEGDFQAYYEALDWLDQKGISYGPSCAMSPIALLFGDHSIAKWRNLTSAERAEVHGTMTGNFRHGPVTISIKSQYEELI